MSIKKIVFIGLILNLISLASFSNDEPLKNVTQTRTDKILSNNQQIKFMHQHQKPGAKVRFSHNYKGYSAVGEIETIELVFNDSYDTGHLQIKLESTAAITFEPSKIDYMFSLDSSNSNTINLSLQSHVEGKHFLNIFSRITDENGYSSGRVFAIAFYVGETAKKKIDQKGLEAESVIWLPSIVTSEPADAP